MIRVRLFAAAAEAAGVDGDLVDADEVTALAAVLRDRYGAEFARVLDRSSFLVDGIRVDRGQRFPLAANATVDVLPPFAGG